MIPKNSNYSSSDEIEPLGQGSISFDRGVSTVTLPITLRENMKTMRENNSLVLYEPGGEQLAFIKITVVNDSGIPGRVSKITCQAITSREATINWVNPTVGGPVEQFKVSFFQLNAFNVILVELSQ